MESMGLRNCRWKSRLGNEIGHPMSHWVQARGTVRKIQRVVEGREEQEPFTCWETAGSPLRSH